MNIKETKYTGAASAFLFYIGLSPLLNVAKFQVAAGIPWWEPWILPAFYVLTAGIGICLFIRPRAFWMASICILLANVGLHVWVFTTMTPPYKPTFMWLVPHLSIEALTFLGLLLGRRKTSDVTSYA